MELFFKASDDAWEYSGTGGHTLTGAEKQLIKDTRRNFDRATKKVGWSWFVDQVFATDGNALSVLFEPFKPSHGSQGTVAGVPLGALFGMQGTSAEVQARVAIAEKMESLQANGRDALYTSPAVAGSAPTVASSVVATN